MGAGMRRTAVIALAGLIATLLPAALARADAFQLILRDYEANQGKLTACKYTTAQLKAAEGQIPSDVAQYAPDLRAAIETALAAVARGDCTPHAPAPQSAGGAPASTPTGGGGGASAGPGAAASQSSAPQRPGVAATPAPPAVPVLHTGADNGVPAIPLRPTSAYSTPAPLVLLGAVGALLLLGGLTAVMIGPLGIGARRLTPLRHAWSEAGFRAGGAFADFTDWVRLGR
jgi:hypothetical protein